MKAYNFLLRYMRKSFCAKNILSEFCAEFEMHLLEYGKEEASPNQTVRRKEGLLCLVQKKHQKKNWKNW